MMEFLATNFNLPTIIVGAIVFGGVGWATWHSHKHGGETLPVKHIISKNQAARFSIQEIGSQHESLRQPVRLLLHFVRERHTQFLTRPQQIAEHRQVTRS